MKVEMNWHKVADEGLPDAAGMYLIITRGGHLSFLPYSPRYKIFNANDSDKDFEAFDTGIEGVWWAEIPAKLQKVCDAQTRAFLESEGF